ncbi:MAG: YolD-like family protein [Muribaculaceae bacterium]|nr:YolD-like family protein [Muribaculaceae bacterium]
MSKYDDIINLPHNVSSVHPPMPMENRAAQFAPFAALTGHAAAIEETGRVTSKKIELSDEEKMNVSRHLEYALRHRAVVTITYFLPDPYKEGGRYVSYSGQIKKIDEYEHKVIMTDGKMISLYMICAVIGSIFDKFA